MWKIIEVQQIENFVCEFCQKKELKNVVTMYNEETGEQLHVGTSCAAKLQKISTKEQKQNEKEFLHQQRVALYQRQLAARNELFNSEENKKLDLVNNQFPIGSIHYDERIKILRPFIDDYNKKEEELKIKYNIPHF